MENKTMQYRKWHCPDGDKLWADLDTDAERIEFLESGQAINTGIIAPSMIAEIVSVFRRVETVEADLAEARAVIERAVRHPRTRHPPRPDSSGNRGEGFMIKACSHDNEWLHNHTTGSICVACLLEKIASLENKIMATPRGEEHYGAKMTATQVVALRKRYARGNETLRGLAGDYGIHYITVQNIVTRKTWRHI